MFQVWVGIVLMLEKIYVYHDRPCLIILLQLSVVAPAWTIIFCGWAINILGGKKFLKILPWHAKICHFYPEIAKFGLILTHWKLLLGGKKIFFGRGKWPHAPCDIATASSKYSSLFWHICNYPHIDLQWLQMFSQKLHPSENVQLQSIHL